jgi:hypothetical protein
MQSSRGTRIYPGIAHSDAEGASSARIDHSFDIIFARVSSQQQIREI